MAPIVSESWLRENLGRPDLLLLEAVLPSVVAVSASDGPNGDCIPGAIPVDLNRYFVDRKSALPHMLGTPDELTQDARELGIDPGDTIVVFGSTRAPGCASR
ncbi:MAG: hypothetical protein JF606_28125 [Burkholderiales bacterium]|nr:hypothetical protein [Burkholderiales bacterium]